jgi:hypothetical protein
MLWLVILWLSATPFKVVIAIETVVLPTPWIGGTPRERLICRRCSVIAWLLLSEEVCLLGALATARKPPNGGWGSLLGTEAPLVWLALTVFALAWGLNLARFVGNLEPRGTHRGIGTRQ